MGPFALDFMLAHRRRFIGMISRSCALSGEALDRYAQVLSWPDLSCNDELPWSRGLIEAHAPCWPRTTLRFTLLRRACRERSVEPMLPLVELGPAWHEHARRIDECRGDRERLEARVSAGEELRLMEVVEWPGDAASWIPELLERAPESTRQTMWGCLSHNAQFPWTTAFIDEHADALSWHCLSHNSGLPWSLELIRRYAARWEWAELLPMRWSSEHDPDLLALVTLADGSVDWSRVVGDMVWTTERFELLRERIEARATDEAASPYWTFATKPCGWTPGFVDRLVALEAEIGRTTIDWQALSRDGGELLWTRAFYDRYRDRLDLALLVQNPAVAVMLEPDVVEAFLGECVRSMMAVAPAAARGATAAHATALGIEHPLEWRGGFIRKAAWFREHDTGDWRLLLRLRPFAFVEELRILDGIHHGLGQFDRARITDADWELLASLPCLTKLALHQVSIEPTSKLRELVGITDLDLETTDVPDLSVLAGMPALRSLVLHEDLATIYRSDLPDDQKRALIDLGPLSEIPNLAQLGLRALDIGCDLRPLRGCRQLETLELRFQPSMDEGLYDLRALDQLPSLRRLWVGMLDPELEALRARYPRLAINDGGPRPWSASDDGEEWARAPDGYYAI